MLFKVKVKAVNTLRQKGKSQAVPRPARPAGRDQEGDRDPRRGPFDRRDHRAVSRTTDGTEAIQADDARPARPGPHRPRRACGRASRKRRLTEGLRGHGGRNNTGRITARRRGGGHKRRYRIVDFKRRKFDVPAIVERLEYDPNRSGVHRADPLRGRRAGLHPGAAAAGRRRHAWSPAAPSTSSPATRCRCRTFRSARSSTTSR